MPFNVHRHVYHIIIFDKSVLQNQLLPSSVQLAIAISTEVALLSLFPTPPTGNVSIRQARKLIFSVILTQIKNGRQPQLIL